MRGVQIIYMILYGNYVEWTQEANTTYGRVYRSGSYNDSGELYPATCRPSYSPYYTHNYFSARVALYIK